MLIDLTVCNKDIKAPRMSKLSNCIVLEKMAHGVKRSTKTAHPNRYLASSHFFI